MCSGERRFLRGRSQEGTADRRGVRSYKLIIAAVHASGKSKFPRRPGRPMVPDDPWTRRAQPARLEAMKRLLTLATLAAFGAARAQEPLDVSALARIRTEGLQHSRVWSMVDTLATVIGPRLTGSPAHVRAANWARGHLAAWGLNNPRLEPFSFGRGWELQRFTLEMTGPRYMPLL